MEAAGGGAPGGWTRERLLLEFAGPENRFAQRLLRGRGPLAWLPRARLADKPLAVVGSGRHARADILWYFTPPAVQSLLEDHRRTVARAELLRRVRTRTGADPLIEGGSEYPSEVWLDTLERVDLAEVCERWLSFLARRGIRHEVRRSSDDRYEPLAGVAQALAEVGATGSAP